MAQIDAQVTDDGSHTLASCSPDSSGLEWMDSSDRVCVMTDKEYFACVEELASTSSLGYQVRIN